MLLEVYRIKTNVIGIRRIIIMIETARSSPYAKKSKREEVLFNLANDKKLSCSKNTTATTTTTATYRHYNANHHLLEMKSAGTRIETLLCLRKA